MKAISNRLSIGTGRPSGSWLMLLLLLAVLVPSVCLLWFMNQAVHNERLAVRQKLAEAYRVNLSLVQNRLDAWCHQTAATLDAEAGRLSPSALFANVILIGLADAAICYDATGAVRYPASAPAPVPELVSDAWAAAERLEIASPADAAAAFAHLAQAAGDSNSAARALQAQARCLVKAGKTNAALTILTTTLEEARFRGATDAQGRLLVPSAELMALELLLASAPDQARRTFERLRPRVLDYDDPALPAAQRRFLMRQLLRSFPDAAVARMLAAEELAARSLEAGLKAATDSSLHPAAAAGVWQMTASRGRVVALHQADALQSRLRGAVSPQLLPAGVTLSFLPPGKEIERAFLSVPAGTNLPGWRLALSLDGQRLFDAVAEQRIASYVWIGVLVFASVILLAALALHLVRRQSALTQLRNDLVANVTHELKTPLSSMRLLVETLLNSQPLHEPTAREYLQLIAQENLRLSRLIDNFLTFSRLERDKYAFDFKPVPAAAIIEGAVTAARERLRVPGCEFKTEVAPDLPAVLADPDAMVTALVNLLDNAFKYSGDEKRITLTASVSNGSVSFAVKDNGIGLSSRDTKRIFKRFFQVDQRLSRSGGGCGLGLSIVKYIVTAHHGRVRVESHAGRGSTFVITLPRLAAGPEGELKPSPHAGLNRETE